MLPKTIFISIPWFSPAFKAGGPIQSIFKMVSALNEGYQFYIFTSNADLHGQPIAISHTDQWVQFNEWTKVWYAGRQHRSQHLVNQVKTIKPDVLYIIGLFDWHFNIVPLLYANAAKKVLSVRGMLHPGALSQKPLKKKIFLQLLKWMQVEKKIFFQATDMDEEKFVKSVFKTGRVLVAGNFPGLLHRQPVTDKKPGQLSMVSIGIISPMKNYYEVLQALKEIKADIQYSIYGPVKDADYWETCLQLIRELPENIKVEYHKELPPHKIASKLQGNHVFILPSKSENYGHAIVEALSAGLPVITSNAVPWTGLKDARAGENIEPFVSDIHNAINRFVEMEQAEYEQYCHAAYEYIRARTDVSSLKTAYKEMFEQTEI